MGNHLVIPDNGDFSTWMPYFDDKINKYCHNPNTFDVPSGRLGMSIFNSMYDEDGATKLENFFTGDGSLTTYIFSKAGVITMLIFGIVILALCITLCFSLKEGFRKFFAKWFCGACSDRRRKRFEDLDRGWKITMYGCASLFVVGCLTLGITLMVGATQTLQGSNSFMCDMWMQLRGHYFGSGNYSQGNVEGIAWNWKGTLAQLDELEAIQVNVTAGPDNPLLSYINGKYYDLQTELNATSDYVLEVAANLNKTLLANDRLHAQIANVFPQQGYDALLQLSNVTMEMCIELDSVLKESLVVGYGNMSGALDFYLGENSTLLHTAYNLSVNAMQSLGDVNMAIANLATTFDSLGTILGALMKTAASFGYIIPIFCFVNCGVFIYLCVKLTKCFHADILPSKTTKFMLKWSYVGWLILSGLSFFSAALTYTFGAAGQDTCTLTANGLFIEGNWNILGGLMTSVPNSSVNLWPVMDTCMRSDGDGDVASALGMTSLITGVEGLTTLAIQNITALPQYVLNPPEKHILANVMMVGFHDQLSWVYRQNGTDDSAGIPYFQDTHYVRPDTENGGYGRWDLLCLVRAYNMLPGAILQECLTDFLYPVASMNEALDVLNQRVVPEMTADATFPTGFCTPYVQQNMSSICPSGATSIDSTLAFTNLSDWQNSVTAATNETFGSSFWHVAVGLWQAEVLRSGVNLQDLVAADGTNDTAWVTCPGATDQNCLFGEYRDATNDWFMETSQILPQKVDEILADVTNFVQDPVLVTMNNILGSAKSALQDFNCQFIGTSMNYATNAALCEAAMPGMAVMWILFMVNFVVCSLAAWITWKNLHFVMDLSREFPDGTLYADQTAHKRDEDLYGNRALENSAVNEIYAGYHKRGTGSVEALPSVAEDSTMKQKKSVEFSENLNSSQQPPRTTTGSSS